MALKALLHCSNVELNGASHVVQSHQPRYVRRRSGPHSKFRVRTSLPHVHGIFEGGFGRLHFVCVPAREAVSVPTKRSTASNTLGARSGS